MWAGVWFSYTSLCICLGVNRYGTIAAHAGLRRLFERGRAWLWAVACVLYGVAAAVLNTLHFGTGVAYEAASGLFVFAEQGVRGSLKHAPKCQPEPILLPHSPSGCSRPGAWRS